MTQNLRLGKNTEMVLTSTDSDVNSNFTLPASISQNGFINKQKFTIFIDGSEYGGFHSWYTATAGSGTSQINAGQASNSVCPKTGNCPLVVLIASMTL